MTPIRSTVAVTGPSTKRALTLVSVSMPASPTSIPMWAYPASRGRWPAATATTRGVRRYRRTTVLLLLQRTVRSNGAWTDSRPTVP